MQGEIEPRRLLRQADDLTRTTDDADQPDDCNLRRAVSSAYYAVFHTIARHAVNHLLPKASRTDQLRLTRSFDHGSIAQICRWLTKGSGPNNSSAIKPIIQSLLANELLVDIAETFLVLQELRHRADYDHLVSFPKSAVLAHVDTAGLAVRNLGELVKGEAGQLFLVLVAMQKSLR